MSLTNHMTPPMPSPPGLVRRLASQPPSTPLSCALPSGICRPNTAPVVVHETPGAALVDGRDGLGGVVAEFCMELAISKARRVGVAWVTARNSNHFGIAGHYSLMAGELGCWRGRDSS